jgi:hypothetical protein
MTTSSASVIGRPAATVTPSQCAAHAHAVHAAPARRSIEARGRWLRQASGISALCIHTHTLLMADCEIIKNLTQIRYSCVPVSTVRHGGRLCCGS